MNDVDKAIITFQLQKQDSDQISSFKRFIEYFKLTQYISFHFNLDDLLIYL